MNFLTRIFGGRQERDAYRPLYDAIVNAGRDADWYRAGEVPDTIDGRFDMIAAVISLTLVRLEADGERSRAPSVLLTEIFIDDMDRSIREIGINDLVVGKHVGKMMGALGGRLAAFRAEVEAGGDFTGPAARNIFRDAPPSEDALRYVSGRLQALYAKLQAMPAEELLAGSFPRL